MARSPISGTYTSGITLTNQADNPVSVTGAIDVVSGIALFCSGGTGGNTWTIDNAGTIQQH